MVNFAAFEVTIVVCYFSISNGVLEKIYLIENQRSDEMQ